MNSFFLAFLKHWNLKGWTGELSIHLPVMSWLAPICLFLLFYPPFLLFLCTDRILHLIMTTTWACLNTLNLKALTWSSYLIPKILGGKRRVLCFYIIFLNLMMVKMGSEFSNLAEIWLISNSGFVMGSTPFQLYTGVCGSMEMPESLLSSKLFQLVRV